MLPGIKLARDVLESHIYFEDVHYREAWNVQGSPPGILITSFSGGDSVLKLPLPGTS
jgi:hypothetical protein